MKTPNDTHSHQSFLALLLVLLTSVCFAPAQESKVQSFRDQVLLLEQRREPAGAVYQALWEKAVSPDDRRRLILALGRVGAPGFATLLTEWLVAFDGKWEREIQGDVSLAVGLLKDASLLPMIAPRVHSSDLARAVGLLGALPSDAAQRESVLAALARDDDQPHAPALTGVMNDARSARLIYGARLKGSPLAGEVRALLDQSRNKEHVLAALYFLGRRPEAPDLDHVPLLAKWLFDDDIAVAGAAARALGRVKGAGQEEAQVLSLGILEDTPPNLLIARLRALASLPCAPPADAVATSMLSDDWRVRRTVFEMLAEQGARALPAERAAFVAVALEAMERDPEIDVRRAAVLALAGMELSILKEASRKHRLTDPWPVRQAIAAAMGGHLMIALEGCPPFDEDPDRRVALAWLTSLPMAIFGAGSNPASVEHLWPHFGTLPTGSGEGPWRPSAQRDAVHTSQLALVLAETLKGGIKLPGQVDGRWPGIVSFAETSIAQTPDSDVESLLAFAELAKHLPRADGELLWLALEKKGQPCLWRAADSRDGERSMPPDSERSSKLSPRFAPLTLDQQAKILGGRTEITVEVETNRGLLRLALFAEVAPCTVAHFLHLAERGFFTGLLVHRVVPSFVVQIGCPRGDGFGGPGFVLPCEISPRTFRRGTLGMALAGPDTGGSQWFICHEAMPHLDMRFTIFGELKEGFEVLDALRPQDVILGVRQL